MLGSGVLMKRTNVSCSRDRAQTRFSSSCLIVENKKKETFRSGLNPPPSASLVKALRREPAVPDQISALQMEVAPLTAASQSHDIVS